MIVREIRLKAVEIEFKAKSDPDFLNRLREDPVAVLQAEGFDDSSAQEVATQLRGSSAELAARCPGKCDPLSCIVTSCCFFTMEHTEQE